MPSQSNKGITYGQLSNFVLGAGYSLIAFLGYICYKIPQVESTSCDKHYHSKTDKNSWAALQKQIMPELVAQRAIIENERQIQPGHEVNFGDPGQHNLVYNETAGDRYLCDIKGNDTVFFHENFSIGYTEKNNYKKEESGFGEFQLKLIQALLIPHIQFITVLGLIQ